MPITTWLQPYEYQTFSRVQDSELNELLQEVRNVYPIFFIQSHRYYRWRKFAGLIPIEQIAETFYTLYIDHGHEAQVMNFAGEGKGSINTGASKATLMNFFFGVLAGLKRNEI